MSPSLTVMLRTSTSQLGRRTKAVELAKHPRLCRLMHCRKQYGNVLCYLVQVRRCNQVGYTSTDSARIISGLLGAAILSSMAASPCRNVVTITKFIHVTIRKTWRARGIFSFRVVDCCWRVWHCSFIRTKSSTSQRCVVYAACWCINPMHCRWMVWKCPLW